MKTGLEQCGLRAMRGEGGIACSLLRAGLSVVEPLYRGVVAARNRYYDRSGGVQLGRPVISVGNITTGGTGKTPMVAWLVTQLQHQGMHPAILMRGYRKGAISDEQMMLRRQLPGVPVEADADRIAAARKILAEHPQVNVFLLDDGFQHRRVAREFDLVLVNSREPFGFDHVLPRGLLREGVQAFKRASAIVLTHADQVTRRELSKIVDVIRDQAFDPDVFRARHVAGDAGRIKGRKVFAVAAIGDPLGFEKQLKEMGGDVVGSRWFGDHHDYTAGDMESIDAEAKGSGAELVVTTEKDWVKMEPLKAGAMEILALPLRIEFVEDDARRLLNQILAKIGKPNVSTSWKDPLKASSSGATVGGSGGTSARS